MIEIQGKYNTAKVYTDNVEATAVAQIIELCNQEFVKDSKIRIMPDTHAGAGCTIGTTMTITDKIVPNLVGVDIGCGVEVVKLAKANLDLALLDKVIRENVPSGKNVRTEYHKNADKFEVELKKLKCIKAVNMGRAMASIGTLGGGNHFIEVACDALDNAYLIVHSGSRYLGKQVAEFYQELAYKELSSPKADIDALIKKLKESGQQSRIQEELAKVKSLSTTNIPKHLAYLEGENLSNYLHDMEIVQKYAVWNRKTMLEEIVKHAGYTIVEQFTTIHNYIDTANMILRKGAISAQVSEKVIIPINMRDGSLICLGKGNPDWNYSAPHGAGRLMSRGQAKLNVTLEQFQQSMEGIYTTSVNQSTVDESAFAYKPMAEIMANIVDTVDLVERIKPVYNFKASE